MKKKKPKVKICNLLSEEFIKAADVVKRDVGVSKTAQLEKALENYYGTFYRDLLNKYGIDLWRQP